jgi:YggT family protein
MLLTLLQILYECIQIYSYVFLLYIILSYFSLREDNPLVRILNGLCAPVQNFFLMFLPPIRIGMFDLSPLYVLIFLQILQIALRRLMDIAG